ncbi:ABC transporter substrate-binding protein [Paenibacillus sp. 598K]|uniref:ABC transporter substrate-binding protein n=1 Tax=Paenibacillus sp. 598K TaxID=1117987 RepID=UPI000FFA7D03|nr:ABC transporter substrate-binding protein [Paenibacillus sp. 598K]GBF71899.1 ABC transporter substrate-binding protein [Paenibacillus sp. 598K]
MNTKNKRKLTVITGMIAVLLLGACSSNGGGTTAAPTPANPDKETNQTTNEGEGASLEEVTLNWYYPQPSEQTDLRSVEEAVNQITMDKLNAKVKLNPVDFGDYEQKLNTVFAAGASDVDLVWTSNWSFVYNKNASKGAFLDVTELLDAHGQHIKASMPEFVWDDVRLSDALYAVPNYQIAAKRAGVVIQKRFVDKYNLDVASIKKLSDLEPFFDQLLQQEEGIIPFGTNTNFMIPDVDGIYSNGNYSYYRNDDSMKLFDIYASPEYKAQVELAHRWYTKGYINQDAATLKDRSTLLAKGNVASSIDVTLKPGGEAEAQKQFGGQEVVFVPLTPAEFTGVQPSMTAISRNSKQPERAMMLLDLVNSDSELYNLLSFGIEGKHYTKIGDNTIQLIADSGYAPLTNWVFGNIMNGYLLEGQPADMFEQTAALNESAKVPATFGFNPNLDAIKTEVASVKAVEEQYLKALGVGVGDPAKLLPEFIDKMKKAGSEKILAEKQRQLDEWLKTKQ